jgi:hypothetical protein
MIYTYQKNDLDFIRNYLNKRKNGLLNLLNSFKSLYFTEYDIFLSHRFQDKKLVEVLFIELSSMGYNVYVDWIADEQLQRKDINRETAGVIRNRIKQSRCLIYVTSIDNNVSKWMPWECGFMDAHKNNVAILPINDNERNEFKGEEFLSLYPLIKKDEDGNLVVETEPGQYVLFDHWINKLNRPENTIRKNKSLYYYFQFTETNDNLQIPAFGIGTMNIRKNLYTFLDFKR